MFLTASMTLLPGPPKLFVPYAIGFAELVGGCGRSGGGAGIARFIMGPTGGLGSGREVSPGRDGAPAPFPLVDHFRVDVFLGGSPGG